VCPLMRWLLEHCGPVMKAFQRDVNSCNNDITFIENVNQILEGLDVLCPMEVLESIEEVVPRVLGVPLDERDGRDLLTQDISQ
jgi:hypothetical protein